MKNVKTFGEFINESKQLNEGSGVDSRKWLAKPEFAEHAIDSTICKQLMEVEEEIEWRTNEMDWGIEDLASMYSEEEDEVWFNKKKKELSGELTKLKRARAAGISKIEKTHPYIKEVERLLADQNLGFNLGNVEIQSVGKGNWRTNPGVNSAVIINWNGIAKINKTELEQYYKGLTMEQFIAVILSMRSVSRAIGY